MVAQPVRGSQGKSSTAGSPKTSGKPASAPTPSTNLVGHVLPWYPPLGSAHSRGEQPPQDKPPMALSCFTPQAPCTTLAGQRLQSLSHSLHHCGVLNLGWCQEPLSGGEWKPIWRDLHWLCRCTTMRGVLAVPAQKEPLAHIEWALPLPRHEGKALSGRLALGTLGTKRSSSCYFLPPSQVLW